MRCNTLYLPVAGHRDYSDGQLYPGHQMVYAYYWSWEAYATYAAYGLHFSSTGTSPAHGDNVRLGFSLRCIKK